MIVVGAGPAGATAARTLASAGISVRLLDRSAFPRNKPCGGGISLRILPRFPYINRELPRIATHLISRLYLESTLLNRALLVPIRVRLHAPLLHEYGRVVLARVERFATEITLHGSLLQLERMIPASSAKRRYSSSRTAKLVSRRLA